MAENNASENGVQITRDIEVGSFEDWEVEVKETKEECGMFEINMRGPNGEYLYKHMTAIEVARFVKDTY